MADDVFAAAVFPYAADLQGKRSAALAELSDRIGMSNPVALQAFVALATSLPCYIANAWACLLAHPDALAKIRSEPKLLTPALEECLRLVGPSRILFRKAA